MTGAAAGSEYRPALRQTDDSLTPPTLPQKSKNISFDSLILTEFARQSAHLAWGGTAQRGEVTDPEAPRALWCLRTDGVLRSLLCAVLPGDGRQTLNRLFREHRPDGSILRLIGPEHRRPSVSFRYGSLFFSLGTTETREYLALSDDFEAFLAGLGKRTRTHIRSSLREFSRQQLSHHVALGPIDCASPEILAAAKENIPRPLTERQIAKYGRHANSQETPFRSELRTADGTLVSLIFGYLSDDHTLIVCQINPQRPRLRVGQAGISLLHRALLIRHQIARGSRGLILVNGCSGMLRPYCSPVLAETCITVAVHPLSWLRCLFYVAARPYLWAFLLASLRADDHQP